MMAPRYAHTAINSASPARKALAAKAAVAAICLSVAFPASAQTAGWVTSFLDNVYQKTVQQIMQQMGLGVENAVSQSGAATQGEILKKAMVDKTVAEGLEAYRQQEQLRQRAQDLSESLRQPANTCQAMALQGGLGNAAQSSKAKVSVVQGQVMKKVRGNTNTVDALETAHKTTNDNLCTAEEAARGVCRANASGKYANLAGADQNALFLFQAKDGSSTYEGERDGPQAKAAEGYIARIVAGAAPPENLRSQDYTRNPQARAYVELMRRYSGVLSMASYSLNQIKEARNPQTGLGNDTKMATISAPGFAPNKADMSMLEAVQRFIATKFSPDSMRDSAKATSTNQILRDIAQVDAFQLWVDHQALQQDSRTEALMALQLAMMTEKTLRPQLEAQRRASASAGNPQ